MAASVDKMFRDLLRPPMVVCGSGHDARSPGVGSREESGSYRGRHGVADERLSRDSGFDEQMGKSDNNSTSPVRDSHLSAGVGNGHVEYLGGSLAKWKLHSHEDESGSLPPSRNSLHWEEFFGMHRSIDNYNPSDLVILTKKLQQEFHHKVVKYNRTQSHGNAVMKSIVIQMNGQGYGSINCFHKLSHLVMTFTFPLTRLSLNDSFLLFSIKFQTFFISYFRLLFILIDIDITRPVYFTLFIF